MAGSGSGNESGASAPVVRSGRRPGPLEATFEIGERLRRRRQQLGLTLRQAAERTGLSQSFLSDVERGRRVPSFWTHEQLRSGLGLDLPDLSAQERRWFTRADESIARRLASLLISLGEVQHVALAAALGISASELEPALASVGDRLAAVGFEVSNEENRVRLVPAAGADVGWSRSLAIAAPSPPGDAILGRSVGAPEPARPKVAAVPPPVVGPLSSPVLIERSAELARLVAAATRPPALISLVGEAGVGKSRLVREMLARAELRGRRILVGNCQPLREPFPFGPVVEALRGVQDLRELRGLPPVVGILRTLLPEIAGWLPQAPEPAGDLHVERYALFRVFYELLSRLGPTVCVLEDLHWADDGTVELLRFLAGQLPPRLVLVLTYRSEDLPDGSPLPGLATRLPPGASAETIELGALSIDGVREMVTAILDTSRVSEEFAVRLHARTEGLPFAIEEVVRLIRERDDVVRRGGIWLREAVDAVQVPPTLRDSILERTGNMGRDAQALTRAAAVLGVPADEEVLAAVAGLGVARANAALAESVEAAVLIEREPGRYGFRHALALQAAYESITAPVQRRLHLRAAAVLERVDPLPVAQLANHYRAADVSEKWVEYAERAADVGSTLGDHEAAARFLLEALQAGELRPATRARLAIKLGRAALLGHAYKAEALAALRTVVDEHALPAVDRGHVRSLLGLLLVESRDASAGYREQRIAARELRPRPDLAAIVLANLALPWVVEGHERDHRRWLDRAWDAAERQENPAVRLNVRAARVVVPLYVGDPTGWAVLEALPDESEPAPDRWELVRLSALLVGACYYLGHYGRARSYVLEADARADHAGWGRFQPLRDSAMLMLDWATGQWPGLEARAMAYADACSPDYPAGLAFGMLVGGSIALARGDAGAAEGRLRTCEEVSRSIGLIPIVASAAALLARLVLRRGDPDGALVEAERGLEILAGKGIWVWASDVAPAAVEALVEAGRADDAAELAARFARGIRARDAPLAHAALGECRGLIALAAGRDAAALRLLAEAEGSYQSLPRPIEAARVRARRGLHMLDADLENGTSTLLQALASFETLGATAEAAAIRKALRGRGLPAPHERRGRRAYGNALSPRERQVAELAARGLSNAQVAALLSVSPKTVEHQMGAILRKLGIRSRAALASRWAVGSVP